MIFNVNFMRRSIRKFNIPPPGQAPGHLNFWRLACSNSLPSGQKSRSNARPTSTEITLLKDKFRLQSNTIHAFQSEIFRNDTFTLLLKEFLTNKGEILSWKSGIPCKNRKNAEQSEIRFKFPTLSTQRSNSPLPGHDAQSNARGMPGGGMLKFRIDRRIDAC